MNAHDLSSLGAGFSDAALGSQSVFRAALHALSHPGRVVALPHDAQTPSRGHAASAALLLALLDPDCTLWLSPSLAGSDAAAWLRFHTGCVLVDAPEAAQFAWVAQGDECPSFDIFARGSDAYPDQSATCVLDVAALAEGGKAAWTLRGPGIQHSTRVAVDGLPHPGASAFAAQWAANHAAFPRGIDLFLATPQQIVGLPRTTRIEQEA
ncbi:phosphonate C-P lyase system protein PhnH [Variovorax sp. ZS18.2.2]|uniref:phosphonate C-P lyase system protein PhnH n=1 Tax=Variovorax sp. ZS18.2.2 TaxID=2971255 RepID=UPI00215154E9|nr:phosphonate C-P lyase system protein PhnH [Variovorax sp. ZS18.2.2]MCR6476810.1 phosphonate C-P lyase system protein PhnH [Variovorax sp. ZS18.2.2]